MEGFVRSRLIWMAEGCEGSIELFVSVGWRRLEGLFDPVVCSDARCLALRLFGAFVVVFVRSSLRFLLIGARLCFCRSCEVFVGFSLRSFEIFVVAFAECFVHTLDSGFGFLGHALLGGLLTLVDRFVEFGMRGDDIAVSQARITEPGSSEDEVGICHKALHTGRDRHVVPFGFAPVGFRACEPGRVVLIFTVATANIPCDAYSH